MTVCQRCGERNPDRFRICGSCGASLVTTVAARAVRKTVTIVFCDLVGSTQLGESFDAEAVREALDRYFDEMRAVLEQHGGTVEKYVGDAVMAAFGLVAVHEDDALRAVRAADGMRRRLAELNAELEATWGIRLDQRIGVNTGDVVTGDARAGQRLATGDAVNTAARLEQAAAPDEILLGDLTYQLVRRFATAERVPPLELKGKAEPVGAFRLVALESGPTPAAIQSALVGRDDELALLGRTLDEAIEGRACREVTIVGSAGVGKSRLIGDFLAARAGVRVLRGRCLSYGEGITFWPLVEAIRASASLDDDATASDTIERLRRMSGDQAAVAERLAPLLGVSDAVFPLEETFWATRRLLEALAAECPLIVVLDDVHWAEPTLLDLVEHVVAGASGPILILCSARPELLDERPAWGVQPNTATIRLDPLSDDDTRTLIATALASVDLPAALVDRISEAAEGNPLFIEQMLSMLVDGGVLARDVDGRWIDRGELERFPVPPTINALIAARLDQLGVDERVVLDDASVIGLVFYAGAVAAMVDAELVASVVPTIAELQRRQLVRHEAIAFADEASFRFDHVLIREAAYSSLLKRDRSLLHERFARWLERKAGPQLSELEEIVGYHLEQSARYLAELGPPGARGIAIAAEAADRLARSGRRALSRGDTPAAANLLERAARLVPPDSRDRPELLLDCAEALSDLGELQRAEDTIVQAVADADALGDEVLMTNARLVKLFAAYTADPHGRSDEVVRTVEDAIPRLEAANDHTGLVRAWRLIAWVHGTACRYGAAQDAVEHAVEHARLAGDRRAETGNVMSLALSALYGPTPVDEAIVIAARTIEAVTGDRRAEGVVRCALAHLYALRGDFDAARSEYQSARQTLQDLGGRLLAATVALDSGRVELLAEDPAAAEAELRHDYDVLLSIGERYTASTLAGLLADAVLRQGRIEEALELTFAGESAAAADDVESQNLWRRVRARSLVGLGRASEGLELVRHALALVDATDAPVLRAATLGDLAEVLAANGRADEARGAAVRALDLYVAKGDRPDAARIRAFLATLGSDAARRVATAETAVS